MAESIRLSGNATPPVTHGVISAANGGALSATLTEIADSTGYVAIGTTAADPPGTFGDLDVDMGGPIVGAGLTSVSVQTTFPASTYTIAIRHTLGPLSVLAGKVLWVLWFEGSLSVPSSGDAPDLVSTGIPTVA